MNSMFDTMNYQQGCFMLVVGASYKGPSHHTMYLRASLAYQFKYEYRLSAL